jgi:very-short-patch-repair endonuclease
MPEPLCNMTFFTKEILEKQKTLDSRKKLLKENATQSELIVKGLLLTLKSKIGKAMFQKGFIAGNGYCICDFYIPKYGICIEIDGGYHTSEKQMNIDSYKNRYLTIERKMRVFRITNKECHDLTEKTLFKMLMDTPLKSVSYSPQYRKFIGM